MRRLSALAAAALAVAALGCGGGQDSSSHEAAAPSTTDTVQQEAATQAPAGSSGDSQGAPGSSSTKSNTGKAQPSIAEEEESSGDHSIQEFGSEAASSERDEVSAAMNSFIAAMGDRDFAKVCSGLSQSNRLQLQQYAKLKSKATQSCPKVLGMLLLPAASREAAAATKSTISRVRIEDGTAFVLFKPVGQKLRYFVMKEEDGTWKATSLAPGTPLNP